MSTIKKIYIYTYSEVVKENVRIAKTLKWY